MGPSGVKSRLGHRARQHQSQPQEQSSSMRCATSCSTLRAGLCTVPALQRSPGVARTCPSTSCGAAAVLAVPGRVLLAVKRLNLPNRSVRPSLRIYLLSAFQEHMDKIPLSRTYIYSIYY